MTIWMSLPSSVIPEPTMAQDTQEVDAWYQRICRAFAHSVNPPQDALLLPRALGMDTEDLAACAIKQVLETEVGNELLTVEMLVDCRSSAAIGGSAPTYRLAAKAGLRTTLPFSLAGQAGAEVAQALTFIQHMSWEESKVVVISAAQRVVPPDTRVWPSRFPLADAAAAIIVARSPIALGKSFRVLSVASGQLEDSQGDKPETVLNRAAETARIAPQNIRWAVAHRCSREFEGVVQRALPNAVWLTRDLHPTVDFGCADSLISLQRVFTIEPTPPAGIGALWFIGRFGATAVILLDSNSVSLWKRYVSLNPYAQRQ